MREYDDDNIRLYTPVLQRVIILLAVIIAVPVVMWTITTMVRTYVAPPKAPTFQRMTETQPADTASIAAADGRRACDRRRASPDGRTAGSAGRCRRLRGARAASGYQESPLYAAAIAECDDRSVAGRTNNGSSCAGRENGGGPADADRRPAQTPAAPAPAAPTMVADTGKRHAGRHK